MHQTIQQVTHDIENFEFNTVISTLMELTNALNAARKVGLVGSEVYTEGVETLLKLMSPVTPHISEELWHRLGRPYSVHQQSWPVADPGEAAEEEITLVVQVNGKVRDRLTVPADISAEAAEARALASENVQRHLHGREPKKVEGTMNSPELVRPEAVREPDEQVKSTPHRKLANLHKVLEIQRTVLHSAATIMIASRATFSAGSS